MGIQGGVAAAVVDDDIVAPGGAVAGGGHRAGVGGIDLGARGAAQVHAGVQLVLSCDGMLAHTVGAGDHIVGGGQRPHELAAHIGRLGRQLGRGLFIFLHQVVFFFDDLGIGLVGGVPGVLRRLLLLDLGGPLGLQLRHVGLHLSLGLLGLGLGGFQLSLFGGDLVTDQLQFLKQFLVPYGDLLNDLPPVEKVGKALRRQQDGQVAGVVVLRHIADPVLHPVILPGLLFLAVLQLDGLVSDQLLQLGQQLLLGGDLVLLGFDLAVQQGDLLLQGRKVAVQAGQLVFQFLFLGGGGGHLVFQGVHLALGDGKGLQRGHHHTAEHQQCQQHRHNGGNDPAAGHFSLISGLFLGFFHSLTPSGIDGW